MAIVPRKKRSISKKKIRHSARQTHALRKINNALALATCKSCGAVKQAHRVCHTCGQYNGKQILTIKVAKKNDVIDA